MRFKYILYSIYIHRLYNIGYSKKKQYCTAIFLDIAQKFDRVWHEGLIYKHKKIFPAPYFLLFKSHLKVRTFQVYRGNETSDHFCIYAGVPERSDLSPDLYNIFTSDILSNPNTVLATYADVFLFYPLIKISLLPLNVFKNTLLK